MSIIKGVVGLLGFYFSVAIVVSFVALTWVTISETWQFVTGLFA